MFDRKKYMREYGIKWRKKNAEKSREYNLRYKQENKHEIKEKRQNYAEKNAFKISQQVRERKFKSRYGITKAEYDLLCASQDFSCAICDDQILHPQRLHVDHDHTTGEIRGLLCGKCNRGIGLLRDDPIILEKAIKYLTLKTQQ